MRRSRLLVLLLVLPLLAGAANAGELRYEETAPTRGQAMLKSALWPGLGQIEQGRSGRGAVWAGGAVALVAGTFYAHIEYHSAALDYENARDSYERALADWDLEAADEQLAAMRIHHPRAEDRRGYRTAMEVALLLWWGGGLVDTWLFGSGGEDEQRLSALPGRVTPVLRRGAAGLAWTLDF